MVDTVADIASLIESELISRKIIGVTERGRTYICSAGAHIFNIENKLRMHRQGMQLNNEATSLPRHYRRKYEQIVVRPNRIWHDPIVEANAAAKDTRIHIITVAPIGTGKSLYLEQFLFMENSILYGTWIKPVFLGSMTEPGWVGTMTLDRNTTHTEHGQAYQNAMSIIGADEFHAIAERMKATHSNTLEDQLLMSLDHGRVSKSLAAGTMSYNTYATLHGGIQPTRISMSSGLARRMCFINHLPTKEQYNQYRQAYFEGYGAQASYGRLQTIRESFNAKITTLKSVTSIDLGMEELQEYVINKSIPHFEIDLLFRLALGWTIMSTDIEGRIEITLTDKIKDIMAQQVKWRDEVKFGSQVSHIVQFLRENGGKMNKNTLINYFVKYQNIQQKEIIQTMDDMKRAGILDHTRDYNIRLIQDIVETEEDEVT